MAEIEYRLGDSRWSLFFEVAPASVPFASKLHAGMTMLGGLQLRFF